MGFTDFKSAGGCLRGIHGGSTPPTPALRPERPTKIPAQSPSTMENIELKPLGKTGIKVPSIGLGTWGIGGYGRTDTSRDKEAIEALRKGIELGMWLIDTAELYGAGYAEVLVGQAVKDFPREKVFIISKVLNTHLEYEKVIRACERSLERLQTDFIDLYLIHFPQLPCAFKRDYERHGGTGGARPGEIHRSKQLPPEFDEGGSKLPQQS